MSLKKVLIIGGGLFGCTTAIELSNHFDVTLIEKDSELMINASKCNHNRIHYGYHYPRSLKTALQSLEGLNSFLEKYSSAIIKNFPNYYAVAKHRSYVSSEEYKLFCDKAHIPYKSEFPNPLFLNKDLIEESFRVKEPIFDWDILRDMVEHYINQTQINVKLNTSLFSVNHEEYDFIINCTYDNINNINKYLGAENIEFKLQDVIVPIFTYSTKKIGLTVMDGPFCSIMPKGNHPNTFLLYHAKYSILNETTDDVIEIINNVEDHIPILIEDASRYFPFIKDSVVIGHWRATRALPINMDDERLSRVILSKSYPKLISVFSGKINTCIDVAKEVKQKLISI
jgi:hypothetical protein